MNTLGIELADQGVILALNNDGDLSFLGLEEDSIASPGVVFYNGKRFVTGKDAQDMSRLYPRSMSDTFWDRLSLDESELMDEDRTICYSELAYQHFKHIWSRVQASGQKVDKVVVAVPGHYLENSDQEEEKIGLILGIAADLKIPLAGITDIANASLFSEAPSFAGVTDPIIHLDVYQHAVLFTELLSNGQLETKTIHRIPNLGYKELILELFPRLANRFLSQTAFDVSHNTETEQQFHNRILQLLVRLNEIRESSIELDGLRRTRKMAVSRNLIARLINDFNTRIVEAIKNALPQATLADETAVAVLSERFLRIPGLRNKISNAFNFTLYTMDEGSAAVGAANMAVRQEIPGDIADTPVLSPIVYSDHSVSPDPKCILKQNLKQRNRSAGEPVALPAAPEGFPTHIVYRGLAYPMGNSEFVISPFKSDDQTGIKLPPVENGDSIPQCRLCLTADGWIMENPEPDMPVSIKPSSNQENTSILSCGSVIILGEGTRAHSIQLIALE